MFGDKLHLYPIILAIYVPVSFLITYLIAVLNDHVEPGFPYISDTGAHPPESCVFGQLLNMGAVLGGVTVYLRYRQVEGHYFEGRLPNGLNGLNTSTLVLGLLMSLGVSIVGNFQETNVIVVHLIGAFFAFGLGWIYCLLQTVMSYKTSDIPGNRYRIRLTRVVITAVDFIFLVAVSVAGRLAGEKKPQNVSNFKWTSSVPGYGEHVASTVSEWIIAILTVIYFLTFVPEFKQFEMSRPKLTVKKPNSASPNGIAIEGEEARGAPS